MEKFSTMATCLAFLLLLAACRSRWRSVAADRSTTRVTACQERYKHIASIEGCLTRREHERIEKAFVDQQHIACCSHSPDAWNATA